MGAVYLAEDTQLFGRHWVVKELLLPNNPAEQQEAERNFQLEAQVLAQLRHPHIPTITAYFAEGGKYFLVMEFAEGEDLEKRLERTQHALPERDVMNYCYQVAQVLEYLAKRQPPVVHRDIKPANIIVDDAGNVHLVDFGIARAKPTQSGTVTRDTSSYGTKGYAPPEQYVGKTEPRSDIYALGATIHHLLTNRDPRDPQYKTFTPLVQLVPNLTPAFSHLVVQMLDPTIPRRPMADEVRQQLDTLLNPQTIVIQGKHKPLVFQGTDVAYTIADLVRLSDKHRALAIEFLKRHHIENWLTNIGRADLAVQASQIRLEVNRRRKTTDPNQALERLLKILDPSRRSAPAPKMNVPPKPSPAYQPTSAPKNSPPQAAPRINPAPILEVNPKQLQLQVHNSWQQIALEISNQGGSSLTGNVSSLVRWLTPFSRTTFSVSPKAKTTFFIRVEPTLLSAGQIERGLISIQSNGGNLYVPVFVERLAPALHVARTSAAVQAPIPASTAPNALPPNAPASTVLAQKTHFANNVFFVLLTGAAFLAFAVWIVALSAGVPSTIACLAFAGFLLVGFVVSLLFNRLAKRP